MNLSNGRLAPAPGTDGLVTRTPGSLLFVASRTPVDQVRDLTELVTAHMDSQPARALARGLTALVAADDEAMLPGFAVIATSASGTYVRVYGAVEVHLQGDDEDVVLTGVGSISGSDREVMGEFHTITARPAGQPAPAPAFDLDVQSGSTAADGFAWTILTSPTDAPVEIPASADEALAPSDDGDVALDEPEDSPADDDGFASAPLVAEGVPIEPPAETDDEATVGSAWDVPTEHVPEAPAVAVPGAAAVDDPGSDGPPPDEMAVEQPADPMPAEEAAADPMPAADEMARDAIPFDELPVADDPAPADGPAPLTEPATMIGSLPPMAEPPMAEPPMAEPPMAEPPAASAPPVLDKGPADEPPVADAPPAADALPSPPPSEGGFTSQLLGALDADEGEEREALPLEQDPADVRQAEQGTVQVQVQGVICSRGHFNDPRSRFCSSCGINMVQNTQVLTNGPRPPLGVMVFEDGATFSLSSDYVVGRQPEVSELVQQGLALPLPVDDPERSISRAHAELRLVDWDVHLVNLSGTNGSFVWDETGQQWVPIPEGQSVVLTPGMRVALGRRSAVFESSLVR